MNCIFHSGGRKESLALQGETVLLSELCGMLEIDLEAEGTCKIGQSTYSLVPGTNTIVIPWSNEEISPFRLTSGKETYSCVFQRIPCAHIGKETLLNLAFFTERLRRIWPQGSFSVDDFINVQRSGQLQLLTVEKPRVSQTCSDLRNKLRQVLIQHVQAICSRPKRGTHTEEIVQDVSSVKKISTNTLSHLASHTEHWKAKKLTGLIPKRLLSVTIEDDINIYENLFFRMAIDDIATYVSEQIRSLQASIRQSSNVAAYEKYQVVDVRRVEMLRELLGSENYDELYISGGTTEEDAYNEWLKLAEIVQAIRNSAFYRQIDKRMRISRNIHQTNILRHDQHYKSLFQIWQELRLHPENELSVNAVKELPDDPDNCFSSYVFLLLIWTMQRKMGIQFASDDKVTIEGNRLKASLHGSDCLCHYTLQMNSDSIGQNIINIKILPPYDLYPLPEDCRVTWKDLEEFSDWISVNQNLLEIKRTADSSDYKRLMNLFTQRGRRLKADIDPNSWKTFIREVQEDQRVRKPLEYAEFEIRPLLYALPEEAKDLPDFDYDSTDRDIIWLTITNPEVGTRLPVRWIRKVLNYGEIPDGSRQRPYSRMYLSISQVDLLSAERLDKSISIHRTVLLDRWFSAGYKQICPSCLHDNVRELDQDTYQCQSCGQQWGKTRCQGKCGKYFLWRQPGPEGWKRLQKEDVQPQQAENMRLLQRDLVFGNTIITDFEYEFDQDGNITKLLPVCPLCGTRRR